MSITHIPDLELFFRNKEPAFDPCAGLTEHGPYGIREFRSIKVAILGSSDSVYQIKRFLGRITGIIAPSNNETYIFPGLSRGSVLRFDVEVIDTKVFTDADMKPFNLLPKADKYDYTRRVERIRNAIGLYEDLLKLYKDYTSKPDVLLLAIPREMWLSCKDPDLDTTRIIITPRQFHERYRDIELQIGHNFHHILKIIGMKYGLKTQLVYPATLEPNPFEHGKQDLCQIAWNFSVALLYKANEIPWRYFAFPETTCFVGITFHRELDDDFESVMRASVAQVFLATGENLILRGNTFPFPDKNQSPKMPKDYATRLFLDIIKKFDDHRHTLPSRIVVHKSSEFSKDECDGIKAALPEEIKLDLISISDTDLRLYRLGKSPVVRGSFAELFGQNYLYCTGFIPNLRIYPGSYIPQPLQIKFAKLTTPKDALCSEILALARLDWNSVDYTTREPVTLTFSRNVGDILSEPRTKRMTNLETNYAYYM